MADCVALQRDIDTMFEWSCKWQMRFNSKKCHILTVTRKRSVIKLDYVLGNDQLSAVDSYPYLGVTVSSDLRWNKHIDNVTLKAGRTLNFIRRNCYPCDVDAKSLAYITLVRPLLEYACSAWDPHTARDINSIEMVQHRAARFAKRDYHRTTSVTSLMNQLGWSPLANRRKIFRLTSFYKAFNGQSAISLEHLARPTRSTRLTSDGTGFIAVQNRTDAYKFSFFPRTINDWNSLSSDIRAKPSVDSFRKALQKNFQ